LLKLQSSVHLNREDIYKHLGFTVHETKSMTYGLSQLVLTARKAMHASQRQCAFLCLSDPALQYQLSETLVSPILRYASEV